VAAIALETRGLGATEPFAAVDFFAASALLAVPVGALAGIGFWLVLALVPERRVRAFWQFAVQLNRVVVVSPFDGAFRIEPWPIPAANESTLRERTHRTRSSSPSTWVSRGTLQIMPLGDSITYGSAGTNAGYRGPLYSLLKTSPIKVLYVGSSVGGAVTTMVNPLPSNQRHNEGHASYTINDISNNLDGLDTTEFDKYGGASRDPNGGHWFDGIASGVNARPAAYPDIILMMIGANNAYASDSDRTAVRNQPHALITKITTQRPNAKLVVAQITPSNRPYTVSYNADVASEVKTFQAAGKQVSRSTCTRASRRTASPATACIRTTRGTPSWRSNGTAASPRSYRVFRQFGE
jgi:hypothetical protein